MDYWIWLNKPITNVHTLWWYRGIDFADVAKLINMYVNSGFKITAAILQNDDGVLVDNRLEHRIPIVDEVSLIDKVPINMLAAVEVADKGRVISQLSNPYGIATLFNLTSEETKNIVPVSRALIGNRSAVVIKTPEGDVKARIIPAGSINIKGDTGGESVDVAGGADAIMKKVGDFTVLPILLVNLVPTLAACLKRFVKPWRI